MMTTKEKLARLNELRTRLGKPQTKAWKETTTKLDEAIRVAEIAVDALNAAPTTKPLPRIARSMGIDPKAARAALRKSHGAAWKSLTEDELRAALAPA